jgi:DNA-binding NtrC family response regulator
MKSNQMFLIYLVDADKNFLQSLEGYLQNIPELKFNIVPFSSSEECMKKIDYQKPDLVILDYILNRNSYMREGVSMLQKIKRAIPGTTLIMISGQDKMEVNVDNMRTTTIDTTLSKEDKFLRPFSIIRNVINTISYTRRLEHYKSSVAGAALYVAGFLFVLM